MIASGSFSELDRPRSEHEVRALFRDRNARRWNALCDRLAHGSITEVNFIDGAHDLGICTSVIAEKLHEMRRVEVDGLK